MLIVFYFLLFFFLVGGLLIALINEWRYQRMLGNQSLSLFFVSSFAISVCSNVFITYLLEQFQQSFTLGKPVILTLAAILCLLLLAARSQRKKRTLRAISRSLNKSTRSKNETLVECRFLLAVVGFVGITQLNGAAIDLITDAWWHMAVVNKMVLNESIIAPIHPLTGPSGVYTTTIYPPFWHMNLALLASGTKLSLPQIWTGANSLINGLTVASYFLLSKALSRNNNLAYLACVLFVLMLGGLNTYHRVMAWPSNVSFLLSYVILYFTINLLYWFDSHGEARWQQNIVRCLRSNFGSFALIGLFGFLTFGIHPAAIFWIAWSILIYFFATWVLSSLADLTTGSRSYFWRDWQLARPISIVILVGYIALAILKIKHGNLSTNPFGLSLLYAIPLFFIAYTFASSTLISLFKNRAWKMVLAGALLAFPLLLLIDVTHLQELFYPNPKIFSHYYYHVPQVAGQLFNHPLLLPAWEHQLREGLLPTGVIAIIASTYLFLRQPSRSNTFLFANALCALLVICSPYLFTWLSGFIPDESVYRIHLLIFSPIIFASVIVHSWSSLRPSAKGQND